MYANLTHSSVLHYSPALTQATEYLILAKCFTEENSVSITICQSQVAEKPNHSDTRRPLDKVQTLCPELRL